MTLPTSIVANVKRFRAGALLGLVFTAACLATGCGGVSGSKSVSPGTFFLPGLMHHQPPATVPATDEAPNAPETAPIVPVVAAEKSLPS